MTSRAIALTLALILLAAGLYQLTPIKRACLRYCHPVFRRRAVLSYLDNRVD